MPNLTRDESPPVSVDRSEKPVDPLRSCASRDGSAVYPTPTQAARGILRCPEVMRELFRLLAFTDPGELQEMRALMDQEQDGAAERLQRYRGRFARWRE